MKESNTFFQICVNICLCLVILTLSINFVVELNIFPVDMGSGLTPSDTTNETMENITGRIGGVQNIWLMVYTGAGIGGLVIAWITRSTTVLGVYIFGAVFWISYIRCLSILNLGQYLPVGFIMIGTTAMGFVFIGAIAGMLSGSG